MTNKVLNCMGCGATLSYDPNLQRLKCGFCGADVEIPQDKRSVPVVADLIAPIGIDTRTLERVTQDYMASGDLTPDDLIQAAVISRKSLMYAPVYVFSGDYNVNWTASFGYDREETYTEWETKTENINGQSYTKRVPVTKKRTVTDWRPVNGTESGSYAVTAYAGTRWNHIGSSLIEHIRGKFQNYRNEIISGFELESFEKSDSEAYEQTGKSNISNLINTRVMAHAQGDHQKDWNWNGNWSKSSASALVPFGHAVFEYNGQSYNFWCDGVNGQYFRADELPRDTDREKRLKDSYLPLWSSIATFFLVAFFLNHKEFMGFINIFSVGTIAAAGAFAYLRRKSIIQYSKLLREAHLRRKRANEGDPVGAESTPNQGNVFSLPDRPLLANTEFDAFLIPALAVLASVSTAANSFFGLFLEGGTTGWAALTVAIGIAIIAAYLKVAREKSHKSNATTSIDAPPAQDAIVNPTSPQAVSSPATFEPSPESSEPPVAASPQVPSLSGEEATKSSVAADNRSSTPQVRKSVAKPLGIGVAAILLAGVIFWALHEKGKADARVAELQLKNEEDTKARLKLESELQERKLAEQAAEKAKKETELKAEQERLTSDAEAKAGEVERASIQPSASVQNSLASRAAMEDAARAILQRVMRDWSSTEEVSMRLIDDVYSEQVEFYGTQSRKAEVYRQKLDFVKRWPERSYTVRPSSLEVSCDVARQACVTNGILDWRVQSKPRNATATGSSEFSYEFNLSGGQPRLVKEAGRTLARSP